MKISRTHPGTSRDMAMGVASVTSSLEECNDSSGCLYCYSVYLVEQHSFAWLS